MHQILSIASFVLLVISIVLLWSGRLRKYWFGSCCVANLLAFLTGVIHVPGIVFNIVLIYTVYYYYDDQKKEKFLPWLWLFIIGLLYLGHFVPGVSNLLLIPDITYQDSVTFDLWLNFDKTLYGLLILAFSKAILVRSIDEYKNILKSIRYELLILTCLLLVIGTLVGFIKFSPKLPIESLVWIFHNLFSTAIAEEAFFRLFLQAALIAYFVNHQKIFYKAWLFIDKSLSSMRINTSIIRHYDQQYEPKLVAIILVSIFFGCTHHAGGAGFVFLSFIAGLFYSWSYYKTDRIEAAITVHFMVNFVHYFFFTYPAYLAS
jgi:membrane protease YdiL (CAAX protease family)